MDFKTSDTNKGKKSLIYDGFIDGVKKCKGHLRTDSAMSTMNAINLEHNHEQDVKELKDSNCDLKSKGKQRTISPPTFKNH